MQKILTYKGYLITASSKKSAESEKWMTGLCIAKSYDSELPAKEFSSADQWDSEREAIDNCVIFGKQIIDGKHPDLSSPDGLSPSGGLDFPGGAPLKTFLIKLREIYVR